MAKFKKRPVVIEAEQFDPVNANWPQGVCVCIDFSATGSSAPHVHTIHADYPVPLQKGDWIIAEPDGIHFYPCKPDIFAATYEPVEELTDGK